MFADLINMSLIYKINNNIFKKYIGIHNIISIDRWANGVGVRILKMQEFENGVKGGKIKVLVPNMMKVDLEMSFYSNC